MSKLNNYVKANCKDNNLINLKWLPHKENQGNEKSFKYLILFLIITITQKYYLDVAHFLKAIPLGDFTLYPTEIIISRL